ncbi:hypothetical protein L1987_46335 [Smallanthus sonchifolius]|uniref:Uncharacterized protein n=1 Tax=Smallanthus sonchifolius TaxID=185202 RepID=A0ACB9FZ59_9ASTR|nr:hypothetical protein L1987_46335 [Smallanthus sonchifolius]
MEENLVVKEGKFLGVIACNRSCKTVRNLSSHVLVGKAEHDDNTLDLLLVLGSGSLAKNHSYTIELPALLRYLSSALDW